MGTYVAWSAWVLAVALTILIWVRSTFRTDELTVVEAGDAITYRVISYSGDLLLTRVALPSETYRLKRFDSRARRGNDPVSGLTGRNGIVQCRSLGGGWRCSILGLTLCRSTYKAYDDVDEASGRPCWVVGLSYWLILLGLFLGASLIRYRGWRRMSLRSATASSPEA